MPSVFERKFQCELVRKVDTREKPRASSSANFRLKTGNMPRDQVLRAGMVLGRVIQVVHLGFGR
jgi:hypothetical protein